jgi:acetyltransferase-like isoleucine patch superfamily enzyme
MNKTIRKVMGTALALGMIITASANPALAASNTMITNNSATVISETVIGGDATMVTSTVNRVNTGRNSSTIIFNDDVFMMEGSAVLGGLTKITDVRNDVKTRSGNSCTMIDNQKLAAITGSVVIGDYVDISEYTNRVRVGR